MNRAELRRLAVSHRQDEPRTGEDVDLTELDLFGLVEVPGGTQDDEQRVVVAFDLGSLVGMDRVLDGEWMELELRRQRLDLSLLRAVEADPRHAVRMLAKGFERLGQRGRRGDPVPADVDGAVDDARPSRVRLRSLGMSKPVVVIRLAPRRAQLAQRHERTQRRTAMLRRALHRPQAIAHAPTIGAS
jgi:hypothetical protein